MHHAARTVADRPAAPREPCIHSHSLSLLVQPGDLLRMEAVVLDVLGFRINTPTAHTFLSMYKQVGHCIGGGGCYLRGRVYMRGTLHCPHLPVHVQAGYGMRLLFCRNLAAGCSAPSRASLAASGAAWPTEAAPCGHAWFDFLAT